MAKVLTRRSFCRMTAGGASLAAAALFASCGKDGEGGSPGEIYLERLRDAFDAIRPTEQDAIRDAANVFADTVIRRKPCFLITDNIGYLGEDMPDLPRLFVTIRSTEMAGIIREGHAVLATTLDERTRRASQSGSVIAGITTPSMPDGYPVEVQGRYRDQSRMEAIASPVIGTHLPPEDGLVELTGIGTPVLPGSGPVVMGVVTALIGESFRRSGATGLTGDQPPDTALAYLNTLTGRLAALEDAVEQVRSAADLAAERLLAGGRFWIYDYYGGLGDELRQRAGVPAFARTITKAGMRDGTLRNGDVLLYASLRSNDPDEMMLIERAVNTTNAVIGICPKGGEGGYRLWKKVHAGLDNMSASDETPADGPGNGIATLPTGGVMNAAVFWTLVGETAAHLAARGEPPAFYMGGYLAGADEFNAEAQDLFERRGY